MLIHCRCVLTFGLCPSPPALQLLSPELMNRQQHKKLQRREVLREFERFPGDTGSTEVQGAPDASRGTLGWAAGKRELGLSWQALSLELGFARSLGCQR